MAKNKETHYFTENFETATQKDTPPSLITYMKALTLTVLGMFCLSTGFSQFYYNDLLMTAETMKRRELLRQEQVKTVQFISLDGANQPIEGFSSQQDISLNATTLTTVTKTGLSGESRNISEYDAKGLLKSTTDTTDGNKIKVEYYYLPSNKLSRIISYSSSDGQVLLREEHIWTYNSNNKPEKMLKIKNNSDSTFVSFVYDENGDLAEEKSTFRGKELPTVFYYYDDQHRLTDIVRFNVKAQRLLPDYIFEYDSKGRIATMLVVSEGTGDYQKWFYRYDEKGLKQQDECYSKDKTLIGKIQYEYRK